MFLVMDHIGITKNILRQSALERSFSIGNIDEERKLHVATLRLCSIIIRIFGATRTGLCQETPILDSSVCTYYNKQ